MKTTRHCWRCGSDYVIDINPGVRREEVGHPGCPAAPSLGLGAAIAVLVIGLICFSAFLAGKARSQYLPFQIAPAEPPPPPISCSPGETAEWVCVNGKAMHFELSAGPADPPWMPETGAPAPQSVPLPPVPTPLVDHSRPTVDSVPPPDSCRYLGPSGSDPDPLCTPGDFDPTMSAKTLCSEGQSRRYKPDAAVAKAIAAAWGAGGVAAKCGEVDHDIALCAGGTNSIKNLWCQPAPDFKDKDLVESEACRRICLPDGDPRQLTPEAARSMILDWRAQVGPLKAAQAAKKRHPKRKVAP